ncbi:uncharacterized protein RAG0_04034 [Rhynchosporium agropyri]|uniref:Uncharacterized protein n=1 Tax=Rhynchosporium agropyri TaxID=914238 RepID=A0A1E1K7E6_9HELO|nr:uncharacterized protein RAG0_04034 [Rhynchosporium agropyri]
MENYIRTSPKATLFIYSINRKGNSALNLAAYEKYPAIIKLLLNHEANSDYQNSEKHSVNKTLYEIRSRQAAEFASLSLQNDKERYQRSSREVEIYREITFTANQARRVIFELLKDSKDFLVKRGLI